MYLISKIIEKRDIDFNKLSLKVCSRNNIIIYKNLNKKLSNEKENIDSLDNTTDWDKMKKVGNPYEMVYTTYNKSKKFESIADYRPLSRSYFKMWEINNEFNLLDNPNNIVSANLAEGPGGFIEAIIKFRKNKNDKLYGITLPAETKYIPDWSKIDYSFGEYNNLKVFYGNLYVGNDIKKYMNIFKDEKADIITADGGFDYSADFNSQEINSNHIIFSEIVIALTIQKKGGSFICKIFDIMSLFTIKLIYLLYLYYDVYIYKPKTSRPANSEKYLVCKNYIGCSDEIKKKLFKLIEQWDNDSLNESECYDLDGIIIPNQFIHFLYKYNIKYTDNQINFLKKTMELVTNRPDKEEYSNIIKTQVINAIDWCNEYNVKINKRSNYYRKYVYVKYKNLVVI